MWVGARVPLLGFQDSQTEYCIIVFFSITVGTKRVTLFSFLRFIEALPKFRQGTAFKVSKLEIFKLLLLNFETTLPTGISSFVYWFSYLLCLAFFQGLKCVCLSKDDLIVPFLDFETMPRFRFSSPPSFAISVICLRKFTGTLKCPFSSK